MKNECIDIVGILGISVVRGGRFKMLGYELVRRQSFVVRE